MVWDAISKKCKLPLPFINIGVKIDQKYYIKRVLQDHLLQNAQNLYEEDYFCYQQNSAPSRVGNQKRAGTI
jgi:hypothetical protein